MGVLHVITDLYILSVVESDDGIYAFDNFEAVEKSIAITWGKMALSERPVLVKTDHYSWNIELKPGSEVIIGTVRRIRLDHVYKEGQHL